MARADHIPCHSLGISSTGIKPGLSCCRASQRTEIQHAVCIYVRSYGDTALIIFRPFTVSRSLRKYSLHYSSDTANPTEVAFSITASDLETKNGQRWLRGPGANACRHARHPLLQLPKNSSHSYLPLRERRRVNVEANPRRTRRGTHQIRW